MTGLYSRKAWVRRRSHQLAIQPLCEQCLAEGKIEPARVADHIEPHRGDVNKFMGPLRSLCFRHHNSWKQTIEIRGYEKTVGADGFPVDKSRHPFYKKK